MMNKKKLLTFEDLGINKIKIGSNHIYIISEKNYARFSRTYGCNTLVENVFFSDKGIYKKELEPFGVKRTTLEKADLIVFDSLGTFNKINLVFYKESYYKVEKGGDIYYRIPYPTYKKIKYILEHQKSFTLSNHFYDILTRKELLSLNNYKMIESLFKENNITYAFSILSLYNPKCQLTNLLLHKYKSKMSLKVENKFEQYAYTYFTSYVNVLIVEGIKIKNLLVNYINLLPKKDKRFLTDFLILNPKFAEDDI